MATSDLLSPALEAAQAIEVALGPSEGEGPFSFSAALQGDRENAYPEEAFRALNALGLHRQYVPAELGGALESLETPTLVWRLVSRRSLTFTIAHAISYLGANPIWVGGSASQRRFLADALLSGATQALGYHEREHGTDLLGMESEARAGPRGWVLNGEKWLINNATRSRLLTLVARTDEAHGPRSFTTFLVDKEALPPGSFQLLPRMHTLGLRGADFSGIRFKNAPLSPESAVAGVGQGLELSLRAFQLTRTIVPHLSLGTVDSGLRMALRFALSRKLYGQPLFAMPYARRVLAETFADLLIAECTLLPVTRAASFCPDRMRLWASVVKYVVPFRGEQAMDRLSEILGARYYLTEDTPYASFQKVLRDNAVLSLFHTGRGINLTSIVACRAGRKETGPPSLELLERLFRLDTSVPPVDFAGLKPMGMVQDDIFQALFHAERLLETLPTALPSDVRDALPPLLGALVEEAKEQERLRKEILEVYSKDAARAPETYDCARRHCLLHAASSCVLFYLHNQSLLEPALQDGRWLVAALHRLATQLGARRPPLAPVFWESVAQVLEQRFRQSRLFSFLPLTLQ